MTDEPALPDLPEPEPGPQSGPGLGLDEPSPAPRGAGYRVLARKYRPATFADVIGQDALVRTLTNAIKSGRLAHAFILTGVRGVGKTTTARIIARALNCIGPDGTGGPTVQPCGQCEPCRAIAADRHVDVIEMDAASRTGVDDIREIIDGVRYGPVSARYKIYIIDEVHMLSRNAFNALLKTLEEPPEHVKFLFATTEIRKVPVTVLSRCQRFDLRRIDTGLLESYFTQMLEKEGVTAEAEAVAMIARAADGSARDGLSLLDQAIALGDRQVTAALVRDMLGLADRIVLIDLFEAVVRGQGPETIATLGRLHAAGADPMVVLQDLLDFTNLLTRAKLVPTLLDEPGLPEAERTRGRALAEALSMAVLARLWQMLLNGVTEVQTAPRPETALEMLLIRIMHAAHLPTPGDLMARLKGGAPVPAESGPARSAPAAPAEAPPPPGNGGARAAAASGAPMTLAAPQPDAPPAPADPEPARGETALAPMPEDFLALARLFDERRETMLYSYLRSTVHLVRFEPGRLELRLAPGCPSTLPSQLMEKLRLWTGRRWTVAVSGEPGAPTLAEQDRSAAETLREEVSRHPTVRAVLDAFPKARITAIAEPEAGPPPGAEGPLVPDAAPDQAAEAELLDDAEDED